MFVCVCARASVMLVISANVEMKTRFVRARQWSRKILMEL